MNVHSDRIDRHLKKIQRLRLLRLVFQFTLLAISVVLFILLTRRIAETYLFYHPVIIYFIAGAAAIILCTLCARIYFQENPSAIARELDRKHQLKDRLSTYIELRNSQHPFLPPLIAESENHLPKISFASAQPERGSILPLFLTSVLALALATFPLWPIPHELAAKAEQHRQIKKESKQLVKEVEQIKKLSDTPPEIKKLAEEFKKAADRMSKPDMDPAQALQKMNEMQKKLSDLKTSLEKERKQNFAKELNQTKGSKSKKDSGDQESASKDEARSLQEALEKEGLSGGKELQEKIQSGKLSNQELKKMQKALENYKSEKQTRDQKLAEMQQSLENARKGMTSGRQSVTYNSKLNEDNVGKQKGGVEDGPGTTNKDAGPQHFDTKKKEPGKYVEDRTKAEYEQLYTGQRENVGKDPLFLGSKWDAEKSRYIRVRTFGEENEPEVVLDQTQMSKQTEAESVMNKEKIPAAYRDLIRRYFNSIEPQ
ncbi:MAG TPA: hypothetical protein VLH08_11250 [Acidobacteriota bacterium]|nr:hypothetical protein [Acidobacteriota bacterium]